MVGTTRFELATSPTIVRITKEKWLGRLDDFRNLKPSGNELCTPQGATSNWPHHSSQSSSGTRTR